MGYNTPIISYENLSKAVARLPNNLRTQFFKATCDYDLTDGTISLLLFEVWLEKRVKDLFNPLVEIISLQDSKSNKHQHIKDNLIKWKTNGKLRKNELLVMQTKTSPDELPSIQG